jgi:DNA-directed RNA polymerase subunit RPC12/RpoP
MEPLKPPSKSTIYVATPVSENSECECPHCHNKILVTRRASIIECPQCANYMHVVFVKKKSE